METEANKNRRGFLVGALAAGGSALAVGVCQADGEGQASGAPAHGGARAAAKSSLSMDSLYETSVLATTLKGEAADRLALRRLVDAWARCADRRLAEEQSNLFVEDGTILNYEGDPAPHEPHSTIKGRVAIRTALAVLHKFTVTLHMNGQSEVAIQGDRAIGESYCLAHEFWGEGAQRKFQTLGIRYHDQFVRREQRWYFVERRVIIDWSDTRNSTP